MLAPTASRNIRGGSARVATAGRLTSVARLAREVTALLARPEIHGKLRSAGFAVTGRGPDALRARIAEEVPQWKAVIDKAGLKFD